LLMLALGPVWVMRGGRGHGSQSHKEKEVSTRKITPQEDNTISGTNNEGDGRTMHEIQPVILQNLRRGGKRRSPAKGAHIQGRIKTGPKETAGCGAVQKEPAKERTRTKKQEKKGADQGTGGARLGARKNCTKTKKRGGPSGRQESLRISDRPLSGSDRDREPKSRRVRDLGKVRMVADWR